MHALSPSKASLTSLNPAVRIRFAPCAPSEVPWETRLLWVAVGLVALSLLIAYVVVVQGAVNRGAAVRAAFAAQAAQSAQSTPRAQHATGPSKQAAAPLVAAVSPR